MKAITLTQPWATLVAIGAKKVETRSWQTDYRGPLAIHAAKGLADLQNEYGLMRVCRSEPFRSVLIGAGYLGTPGLPRGAIVAVCRIAHIGETTGNGYRLRLSEPLTVELPEQELAFGSYELGRFAWLLADVRALPKPIPAKGALGLWNWDEL